MLNRKKKRLTRRLSQDELAADKEGGKLCFFCVLIYFIANLHILGNHSNNHGDLSITAAVTDAEMMPFKQSHPIVASNKQQGIL